MEQRHLKIAIEKADGMQAFGAYVSSPAKSDNHTILLNVYATLLASIETGISAKQLILETLMHEFGHAMQSFLELEFTEDVIEGIIDSYAERYGERSYEEVHGNQTL